MEPGGFHLELCFACPCPGGKDLQDQPGAVENLSIKLFFQVAHLHGGQGFIKNYNIRVMLFDFFFQLHHLAASDISGVRDLCGVLDNRGDDLQTAGVCQSAQLAHGTHMFFGGKVRAAAGQHRPGLPAAVLCPLCPGLSDTFLCLITVLCRFLTAAIPAGRSALCITAEACFASRRLCLRAEISSALRRLCLPASVCAVLRRLCLPASVCALVRSLCIPAFSPSYK